MSTRGRLLEPHWAKNTAFANILKWNKRMLLEDMRNWRIVLIWQAKSQLVMQQRMSTKLAVFNKTKATSTDKVQTSNYTAKPKSISSVVLGLINEPCKSTKGPEHRFPKLPDRCFWKQFLSKFRHSCTKRLVNMPRSHGYLNCVQFYNWFRLQMEPPTTRWVTTTQQH